MNRTLMLPALVSLVAFGVSSCLAVELKSPDEKTVLTVETSDTGQLFYRLTHAGKTILAPSRLGLVIENDSSFQKGLRIVDQRFTSHDTTWKPVYGERSEVRDCYNQLVLDLQDRQKAPRRLRMTFRAYNEGVAWNYTIPDQPELKNLTITEELTQFRFDGNHVTWPVYSAQGIYTRTRLDQIKPDCERPLVVELEDGPVVALAEARLVNHARMRLRPAKTAPWTLQSQLAGEVAATTPCTTPWRVVMIGQSPGQLLEQNYLILNLNDPCAIADTSWIKPGKVIREVTLTTDGGKACVDFAVKMGLQYVEYDAGWYGHEYDDKSDATTVTRDPKKSGVNASLDLQEVIRYANQRDIGILLYVNRRQLERQLDEVLPLFEQWGVKGVKYGFVRVGSQQWTTWLHDAVRKAARHHLMVDVHDEYRPTGYERTYPNLMTSEGVRGNECMPPAELNLVIPFTRSLCGPADYTVCWYTDRVKTTRAHQLAAPVVFYSPLQFLFWYDQPRHYQGERELEFFKTVPVVWDETRVLQGEIGQFAVIARRVGEQWYIGILNAAKRRQLEVPLSFLADGRKYQATIYADAAPGGENPRRVSIREITVDSNTVLHVDMAANGGQAIRVIGRQ